MRKFLVKFLSLQCTVVKGSILSLFVLFLFVPLFLLISPIIWLEERCQKAPGKLQKFFTTPIPFPGSKVIEEASQACDMNIKKYERFLFRIRD